MRTLETSSGQRLWILLALFHVQLAQGDQGTVEQHFILVAGHLERQVGVRVLGLLPSDPLALAEARHQRAPGDGHLTWHPYGRETGSALPINPHHLPDNTHWKHPPQPRTRHLAGAHVHQEDLVVRANAKHQLNTFALDAHEGDVQDHRARQLANRPHVPLTGVQLEALRRVGVRTRRDAIRIHSDRRRSLQANGVLAACE